MDTGTFQFAQRYIPTPVGRLILDIADRLFEAVHPHACGEIYSRPHTGLSFLGTSPRLWGDLTPLSPLWICNRYIPTPVGRLYYARIYIADGSVHPHACGEIIGRRSIKYVVVGTSPRLWGDSRRIVQ